MHEVSICESIFRMLEDEIPGEELNSIREIHLKIGILSNIEPQILEHVFGFMITDSSFKDAKLCIERTDVIAECESCGHSFKVEKYRFICPDCGTPTGRLLQGKELEIYKIVFEKAEELTHEEVNQ